MEHFVNCSQRRMRARVSGLAVAGVLSSFTPAVSWGCATCGCTLSADAATGYSVAEGFRLNFEYDYVNQDRLRGGSGLGAVSPQRIVNNPSDPSLGGGEVEKQTINRYLTVGLSYSPNGDWNIDLLIPYVMRSHTTYGTQLSPYAASETAPDQISGSRLSDLGDVKIIASYQGILATRNFGVQLGVKLPTGHYGTKVNFDAGPLEGDSLDASLQAGTGSTDLIVGAYYYRAVSQDFDAFINGQYQAAVAHKQDEPDNDFKPGNQAIVSFGLRYAANPKWISQLQVNLSRKNADQGALADRPDTAGTVAYLSPGVTVRVLPKMHLFGFVQVPVYSKLDGYQLAPRWTATVGGVMRFE